MILVKYDSPELLNSKWRSNSWKSEKYLKSARAARNLTKVNSLTVILSRSENLEMIKKKYSLNIIVVKRTKSRRNTIFLCIMTNKFTY